MYTIRYSMYLIASWAGGARDMWRRRRAARNQVGHHPELHAQHLQHLLEQGWRPSTNSFTPVTSFYKCGGVLIPEVQLQLLQDKHTPSLRGCSRVAWQAPMWVVVRPARSEKKATCCSYGSVNMQQGGAWGRRRRRGGVIFIFEAEVLKVKVIPNYLHLYILWFLLLSSVLDEGSVDPKVLAILK